jgi:hypothetical protein
MGAAIQTSLMVRAAFKPAVAADRGPDDVNAGVEMSDDFRAGSHHGQPGDVGAA